DRSDLAASPLLPQRGPLLVNQAVAGKMSRPEADGDLQVVPPVIKRRTGHSEDQVERPAREPGLDDCQGLFHFDAAMVAFEGSERFRPKRLGTEAHAVH